MITFCESKNPCFGQLQVGYIPKTGRCLLKTDSYDYSWAKDNGLNLRDSEILVRVENSLTKVSEGVVWNASIAKLNTVTGSLSFTDGEEGVDLRWGKTAFRSVVLHSNNLK